MLRVNLLPPYIFDKQKKARFVFAWAAVLALVILGMGTLVSKAASDLKASDDHLTNAKNLQTTYQDTDSKIKGVQAAIADTQSKQKFIADAQTYNNSWPRVYTGMASVVSPDIVLNSMNVDAGNHRAIRMNGFTEGKDRDAEMKLARWWMSLRNNLALFDTVTISLPAHPYTGGNGGATNGGLAMNGGFGGFGGRGMGGMPGGPGGMPNMPRGMGGGRISGMGSGMMPGGPGGFGGGRGFGGGGGTGNAQAGILEGKTGLNFVALAVVKDILAPPSSLPTWPLGGGGGGGFGGGMGGMMMPGGRGGMMPGGGMPSMMPGGPGGPGMTPGGKTGAMGAD